MPGSTNFLTFNPAANNQENDATYNTDITRTGGVLLDQILPSPLANKMWFQSAQFISAFCTMMADKGFSPMDGAGVGGGFNALVAVLTNVKTSADFTASIVLVPYATSITFDANLGSGFDLTLTGNVSASTLINQAPGDIFTFIIAQDATGGRTFAWPPSLVGTAPICPLPNSVTVQQFIVRVAGQIVPTEPMIWLTSGGVVLPPPIGSVVQISTSGNITNIFPFLTEIVNATSGPITRTLYSAVGFTGYQVNVKNLGSLTNTVLVVTSAGQTIDGFANFSVAPYNSITFQSTGANWILI